MRKVCILACLALMAGLPALAAAETAEEIVAKYAEALGGREKVESIQTWKATGKSLRMGMEFPFIRYQKAPNLMRTEVDIQGAQMIVAFDGSKGWMINPMTGSQDPIQMPEVESKMTEIESCIMDPLLDYKNKGYTIELVGEDDVEGTAVLHVRVETKQDLIMDYYLDAEYYLPIKQTQKITQEGNVIEMDNYFSDYKDVGGVLQFHAIETRMGGQTLSQVQIETLEFNVEVDESIFVMPAPAAEAGEG